MKERSGKDSAKDSSKDLSWFAVKASCFIKTCAPDQSRLKPFLASLSNCLKLRDLPKGF